MLARRPEKIISIGDLTSAHISPRDQNSENSLL
jgi:hypothetical protein